nr:CapA family protein [Methanobacterium alcaliphilum]
MIFTGDVMLGRNIGYSLDNGVDVFAGVRSIFQSSDFVVANIEAPFTDSSNGVKSSYCLKAKPKYAKLLADNNIKVACLANNHIMDYGIEGYQDCVANLDANGILHTGAGSNIDEAITPAYVTVDGKKIAIIDFQDKNSFLAYSDSQMPTATNNRTGYAPAQLDLINKSVETAKANADFVVVDFHFGNELHKSPNQYQYKFARAAIDAGADLVVGHHPHVFQKIENYKGKLIFYSLGNTIFDAVTPACRQSALLRVKIVDGDLQATLYPISISSKGSNLMSKGSAEGFLKSIPTSGVDLKIDNGEGKIVLKDYMNSN